LPVTGAIKNKILNFPLVDFFHFCMVLQLFREATFVSTDALKNWLYSLEGRRQTYFKQ